MRRGLAIGAPTDRRSVVPPAPRLALVLGVLAAVAWGPSPAAAQAVAPSSRSVAPSAKPVTSPPAAAARLAPPEPGEAFDAWCERLSTAQPFVPLRCTREHDWTEPTHPSRTQRVRWAGTDVAGAFELARALFSVPASVVPPRTGPREQTIEDPRKPAAVWESTLTVRRAADGTLREARWFERREGSGRTVVARRVDARFLEVSEVSFAD